MASGCAYAGWCPKGGWAEDFPEPPGLLRFYPALKETPTARPEERSEWNVRDATATLIIMPDNVTSPGTEFTMACARRLGKHCHFVRSTDDAAIRTIQALLASLSESQSLNIAGPRESEAPGIYARCRAILIEAFR